MAASAADASATWRSGLAGCRAIACCSRYRARPTASGWIPKTRTVGALMPQTFGIVEQRRRRTFADVKRWPVAAARNFDGHGIGRTLRAVVLGKPLPQFEGLDPHDGVAARNRSVTRGRTPRRRAYP